MHYITTEMDEMEREEFFRIKRTQQKKMIRAQKAAEAKKVFCPSQDRITGDAIPPQETVEDILAEVDKIATVDDDAKGDKETDRDKDIETGKEIGEANEEQKEIVQVVDQVKADIESVASEEIPPPTASGEPFCMKTNLDSKEYIVESPKESKEHFIKITDINEKEVKSETEKVAKPIEYQGQDLNKFCDGCCSETLKELKRKIALLIDKINDETLRDVVVDQSTPCDTFGTEPPLKPKQGYVDSGTQVNTDLSESLNSGGPNIKAEGTAFTETPKKERSVVQTVNTSDTPQKQSGNDEISSLPSVAITSKSESPLNGSSLGYVKKIFKETVKIKRLPNRSGKIYEEKEVITVKSEIKKYKGIDENDKANKDFYIDDISIISSETAEAGPSNKIKYCRLCQDNPNENNTTDCSNKCKDKKVQYSDESKTCHKKCNFESVNHVTLPSKNPLFERKSDYSSLPIVEEYDLDNTLREFGWPLWHDLTENISIKLQSDNNTCYSEAISKDEEIQNSCNLSSFMNDTESSSRYESDDILSDTVALNELIQDTEILENKNDENEIKYVDQEKPNICAEALYELSNQICRIKQRNSTKNEFIDNLANNMEPQTLTTYNINSNSSQNSTYEYVKILSDTAVLTDEGLNTVKSENLNNSNEIKDLDSKILNSCKVAISELQHITKHIEFIDNLANVIEEQTLKTNDFTTNLSKNEVILSESNEIRVNIEFNNEIDTKRSIDKRVYEIQARNNNNSEFLTDSSNNSCMSSLAAKHVEDFEKPSAILSSVGSETSSQRDKIDLSGGQSIPDSPRLCSDQCLACGYRDFKSIQERNVLSFVGTESIFKGKITKSEYCSTDLRDLEQHTTSDACSLRKRSFDNCRGVVNTFKGYLAKIWQQTKTANRNSFKDCIYYQIYDSKDETEEKEAHIQKELNSKVVDVKVNCPMCEKDAKEDSNGIIKKLFENIQQSLKKSFITKNSYSQTSESHFELLRECSNISQCQQNSSHKFIESSAKILMKCMFDEGNKFINDTKKYYVCPLKKTDDITQHYCPLCAADTEKKSAVNSNPSSTNNINDTKIEIIEFDTIVKCPDCLEEQNTKYAIDYNGESTKPPRFTKTKFNVYHQYMVHTDNCIPKCFASGCTANCNTSFCCSDVLDPVDSQLINIIDMLPSVRTNADFLKQAVISGIMEAEKRVEIFSNTIRGVKNKVLEIELRFVDADRTCKGMEASSSEDTTITTITSDNNTIPACLSKESGRVAPVEHENKSFQNVVDSLTSFIWKSHHKNENCHSVDNAEVCHACNRPFETKIDECKDYCKSKDAYAQTTITLSCPLKGKCMSKCKSRNVSNNIEECDYGNQSYEQKSSCCKSTSPPKISFAGVSSGETQHNTTKKIGNVSCKLCKEAYKIQNSFQNVQKVDNFNADEAGKETSPQICSNVPVNVLLERAKNMEPAIIRAIKKIVKCGNDKCIKKLTSVFISENNSISGDDKNIEQHNCPLNNIIE